jgi:hypothetical protein
MQEAQSVDWKRGLFLLCIHKGHRKSTAETGAIVVFKEENYK